MALPKMFKLPSHNRFEYQPLYYDEKKEQMKERLEKYNKSEDDKEYKADIKGKFQSKRSLNSSYSSQKRISNIRLLIIIGFISAILFYIMQNQGLISYMFNALFEK